MRRKQCPGRPAQVSGKMCETWIRMSHVGEFLDSRDRTPEREPGGRDKEAQQEKGKLNWMGIRQKIHVTRNESHLTLGLT